MDLKDRIKEYLENLGGSELATLWDDYCDYSNYTDDYVYDMDMIDEMFSDYSPMDILQRAFYGDFNPSHDYFKFNGYANLESSDYVDELISIDDLADSIIDNDEDFGFSDIRDILDEAYEDEEE